MTVTEIKAAESDVGTQVHGPNKVKEKSAPSVKTFGLMDYVKAMQIVAHEIYIDKQHMNMRNNCDNTAFMRLKAEPEAFCNNQLETMLDLTLWTDKI